MADLTTVRSDLHKAIQTYAAHDEDIEGAVLIGWVCVAEWMDPSGVRWLSRIGAPGDPSQNIPSWQLLGYLHAGLDLDDWDFEASFEPPVDDE